MEPLLLHEQWISVEKEDNASVFVMPDSVRDTPIVHAEENIIDVSSLAPPEDTIFPNSSTLIKCCVEDIESALKSVAKNIELHPPKKRMQETEFEKINIESGYSFSCSSVRQATSDPPSISSNPPCDNATVSEISAYDHSICQNSKKQLLRKSRSDSAPKSFCQRSHSCPASHFENNSQKSESDELIKRKIKLSLHQQLQMNSSTGDHIVHGSFQNLSSCTSDASVEVGKFGESIVYNYLCHKYETTLVKVSWVNAETETLLPYDILVELSEQESLYVEVKATSFNVEDCFASSRFDVIPFSKKEFEFASSKGRSYLLFRVYKKPSNEWNFYSVLDPVKALETKQLELRLAYSATNSFPFSVTATNALSNVSPDTNENSLNAARKRRSSLDSGTVLAREKQHTGGLQTFLMKCKNDPVYSKSVGVSSSALHLI